MIASVLLVVVVFAGIFIATPLGIVGLVSISQTADYIPHICTGAHDASIESIGICSAGIIYTALQNSNTTVKLYYPPGFRGLPCVNRESVLVWIGSVMSGRDILCLVDGNIGVTDHGEYAGWAVLFGSGLICMAYLTIFSRELFQPFHANAPTTTEVHPIYLDGTTTTSLTHGPYMM